jgi:hypothetical protein
MAKAEKNRWPLAIALAAIALMAAIWGFRSAMHDPTVPSEPVQAGATPVSRASEESFDLSQPGALPNK